MFWFFIFQLYLLFEKNLCIECHWVSFFFKDLFYVCVMWFLSFFLLECIRLFQNIFFALCPRMPIPKTILKVSQRCGRHNEKEHSNTIPKQI